MCVDGGRGHHSSGVCMGEDMDSTFFDPEAGDTLTKRKINRRRRGTRLAYTGVSGSWYSMGRSVG